MSRAELEARFSLGDPDELAALLRDSRFDDVELELHPVSIEARFADADHVVERMEYAYAAVVPQFAHDPAAFDAYLHAIGRGTAAVVADHRDGDCVVVPMHANVAVAT